MILKVGKEKKEGWKDEWCKWRGFGWIWVGIGVV